MGNKKMWIGAVTLVLIIILTLGILIPLLFAKYNAPKTLEQRVKQILEEAPVIDGHNDFPWSIRVLEKNQLQKFNFSDDIILMSPWNESSSSHTSLPRLKTGKVGGQFWAAYVNCESQYKDAVQQTLEQIDVIKRLIDLNPNDMQLITNAADIEEARLNSKIASMIGIEGGHSIGNSLGVLRTMYSLGARYLTLTHSCVTPWADSSAVDSPGGIPEHNGLTEFGKTVVREMNRLGMMIDLSHVSYNVMKQAIEVSRAPVIFSHSSAYTICNATRNVRDDVLQSLKEKDGIVMVNFYSGFVACGPSEGPATIDLLIDHINHIRDVAGIDHVGIGADYDGMSSPVEGLDDVSHYPELFEALAQNSTWTDSDLRKLSRDNIIRIFHRVEEVRDEMKAENVLPYEDLIPEEDLDGKQNCTTTSHD